MCLNYLPDDIVYSIGKYVLQQNTDIYECWKGQLAAISMCRRWRHIMLPDVSRSLFIVYGKFSDVLGRYGNTDDIDKDMDRQLITNAGLLANAVYSKHPMHLSIRLFYANNPLPSLEKMLNILTRELSTWSNVTKLSIHLSCGFLSIETHVSGLERIQQQAAQIIKRLTAMFPNVVNLELADVLSNAIANILYQDISDAYSSRVCRFKSLTRNAMLAPVFSSQLTHLEINLNEEAGSHLPQACADSLMELSLLSMSVGHQWNHFTGTTTDTIVFPWLKSLQLFYIDRPVQSASQALSATTKLVFPRLKHFDYKCKSDHVPFFGSATLPSKMRSISIDGGLNVLKRVVELNLPDVDKLSLAPLAISKSLFKNAILLLDCIFAKTKINIRSELRLSDIKAVFDGQVPAYASLSVFKVYSFANIGAVIGTVGSIQKLVSLEFENIVHDAWPDDVPVAKLENNEPVSLEPFNAQISSILLGSLQREYSQDSMLLLLAKYLLLRLPSLRMVRFRQLPGSLLTEFIENYQGAYPHLKHLEIKT